MKKEKLLAVTLFGLLGLNSMASGVVRLPVNEVKIDEPQKTEEQLKREKLAKQLSDPCSNLISIPLEFNTYERIGPNQDGTRSAIKYMPVVPVNINEDWNLILRTVGEVVTSQDDLYPGYGSKQGLSDAIQSFFLSPTEMSENGTRWGVGSAVYMPTATDDYLGTDQWGLGPTAAVINQTGSWTVGGLWHQLWKVGGDSRSEDINFSYFQPFVVYTTQTATSFVLNTESTYDFEASDYEIPINFQVMQIVPVGDKIFQLGIGARYYASHFENGPRGFGLRGTLTILLPTN